MRKTEDYQKICMEYAYDVVNGNILSCQATKDACLRFLDDMKREKDDKDFPYHMDWKKASSFLKFAEKTKLKEEKWAGKLLVLSPWQIFIFCNIYGWLRNDNNRRRFRKVFLQVGRKAGKSSMVATTLLYDLLTTKGGQAFCLGTTREQAKMVYDSCKSIVKQDEVLNANIRTFEAVSRIVNPTLGSRLEALASDSNTLDGLNVSLGCLDEVGSYKNANLVNVIESSQGSREEPLLFMIGSATDNLTSFGKLEHDRVKKMLHNRVQDGKCESEDYFGIIYEIDDFDDWKDPTCYPKANPNLGYSNNMDFLLSMRQNALEQPTAEVEFVTKCLGRYRATSKAWINTRSWDKVIENSNEFKLDLTKPYTAVAGIDLSKRIDLTAYTICFHQNGKFFFEHHFYFPEDSMNERMKRDNEMWYKWVEDKYLTATTGKTVDYKFLLKDITETVEKYEVKRILFDPYNSLVNLIPEVESLPCDFIELPQTFTALSPMLKDYEEQVIKGNVVDDNPVMRWMIGNAVVKQNENGEIKVFKPQKDAPERIDGCITSSMALGELMNMIRNDEIDERPQEERVNDLCDFLSSVEF